MTASSQLSLAEYVAALPKQRERQTVEVAQPPWEIWDLLPAGREARTWAEMEEIERSILRALSSHVGKARAIHIPELAKLVGIHQRELQTVVKRMVETHGIMIARGLSCGAFIIATPEEGEEAARNLESRGLSDLVCAGRLRRLNRSEFHALLDQALGKLQLIDHGGEG